MEIRSKISIENLSRKDKNSPICSKIKQINGNIFYRAIRLVLYFSNSVSFLYRLSSLSYPRIRSATILRMRMRLRRSFGEKTDRDVGIRNEEKKATSLCR